MPDFAPKNGVPYSQEDADTVGPALLEVIQECGGAADKDDVLAAARRRGSPLRKYVIDRPLKEAAEAHYREQAAKLLRSFEVVWTSGGRRQRADLVYYVELVAGEDDEEEVGGRRRNRSRRKAYVPTTTVMDNQAYQEQILAEMQEELAAYQNRYEEFAYLVDFRTRFGRAFRAICRMFDDAA